MSLLEEGFVDACDAVFVRVDDVCEEYFLQDSGQYC
jgi:hypothetical protein